MADADDGRAIPALAAVATGIAWLALKERSREPVGAERS